MHWTVVVNNQDSSVFRILSSRTFGLHTILILHTGQSVYESKYFISQCMIIVSTTLTSIMIARGPKSRVVAANCAKFNSQLALSDVPEVFDPRDRLGYWVRRIRRIAGLSA